MRSSLRSGFTLIEILVVVSIIAILASVTITGLSSARGQGRNAFRKATLKELQATLELYYNVNNAYPLTSGAWYSSEPGDSVGNNGGNWIPGLAPNYIQKLPRDPRGGPSSLCGGWQSSFLYKSDGTNYKLLSHCAPEGTMSPTDEFYDPIRSTWAWMVCSGEPACSTW